ncbi:MAG: hypothetical protein D6689_03875 [Deltaproteobacteria bacterium]|nr:MAG: hypothetical protein D6689_03875 [Deltaproteobacteria bacterium]
MKVSAAWLAAIGAVAATAGTARAQPQMPNPRVMSGMARPEPNDPPGRLTARVVQGGFAVDQFGNSQSKFPPGHIVHLVAVGADGKVSLQSLPVDENGRAVFQGLATDGSRAYFLTTLLPRGDIDDHVGTREPIGMPPKVGMRVLLAGPEPDASDPPVDDLSPEGLPPVPAGQVVVEVRGMVDAAHSVRLVDLTTGGAVTAALEPLQDAKVARFTGVAGGNDKVYIAEVVAGGRVYRSQPIQVGRGRGGFGSVFVYPSLLMQMHAGAEVDDDRLWFQVQFVLANGTGAPYLPGDEGIVIPLPRGFVAASVDEQNQMRVKVDKQRGLVWRGAFPPGQRAFVAQFAIPIEDGRADFVLPLPFGAIDSQISLRANAGVVKRLERCRKRGQDPRVCDGIEAGKLVESDQIGPARFSTLADSGTTFLVMPGINVRAGGTLRIAFKGLPQPPRMWRYAGAAAAAIATIFIALGIATAMRSAGDRARDTRRDELVIERDDLLRKLVALEKDHLAGRVADDRYDQRRSALKRRLSEVVAELRTDR